MIYPEIWEEKNGRLFGTRRVTVLFLEDRCPCLNAAQAQAVTLWLGCIQLQHPRSNLLIMLYSVLKVVYKQNRPWTPDKEVY